MSTPSEDFFKLKMVVESCETKNQYFGALKYVDLFLKKYMKSDTISGNHFWWDAAIIRREIIRKHFYHYD